MTTHRTRRPRTTTPTLTTIDIGLPATLGDVWRLDLYYGGSNVTVYSYTEPDPELPEFGITRIEDDQFALGFSPGAHVRPAGWETITGWKATLIPGPATLAGSPAKGVKASVLTDDELFDLMLPHAQQLATDTKCREGFSRTKLLDICREDSRITGDIFRLRKIGDRAIDAAREHFLASDPEALARAAWNKALEGLPPSEVKLRKRRLAAIGTANRKRPIADWFTIEAERWAAGDRADPEPFGNEAWKRASQEFGTSSND